MFQTYEKYGMAEYNADTEYISINNDGRDDITFDTLRISHPRATITLRKTNNEPHPYNLNTIIDIITKGNGCDPLTRIPFPPIVSERVFLYQRCIQLFPDYNINMLDTNVLFRRWLSTYYPNSFTLQEIEKIRIEARCFLQAEDLVSLFKTYLGKANMENRKQAEKELENKPDGYWLLRNSSLIDSKWNKAFALSIKISNKKYKHIAIVHKIGEGLCFNCNSLSRGSGAEHILTYETIYPTIIDMLEDTVMTTQMNIVNIVNLLIKQYKINSPSIRLIQKPNYIMSCSA